MSSQLGTAFLALLPVLKQGVTLGQRVKHNVTNALWGSSLWTAAEQVTSARTAPQFSFRHCWHNQGASWKGRGVAPPRFVPDQQSQVSLKCNKSQLLQSIPLPPFCSVLLPRGASCMVPLRWQMRAPSCTDSSAQTPSTFKNVSLSGTGLCALGRALPGSQACGFTKITATGPGSLGFHHSAVMSPLRQSFGAG